MKRAFAICIVVLLAIGMVALFFIPFIQSGTSSAVHTPSYTTTQAPTEPTPTPTPAPAPFNPAQAAQ